MTTGFTVKRRSTKEDGWHQPLDFDTMAWSWSSIFSFGWRYNIGQTSNSNSNYRGNQVGGADPSSPIMPIIADHGPGGNGAAGIRPSPYK